VQFAADNDVSADPKGRVELGLGFHSPEFKQSGRQQPINPLCNHPGEKVYNYSAVLCETEFSWRKTKSWKYISLMTKLYFRTAELSLEQSA